MRHYLITNKLLVEGNIIESNVVTTTRNQKEAIERARQHFRIGNIERVDEVSFSDFSVLKDFLPNLKEEKQKPVRRNTITSVDEVIPF